ncbi:MAG: hypothetical protein AB1478_00560 [Nitrospirota bacterium]
MLHKKEGRYAEKPQQNLLVATQNNAAAICMSIEKAARLSPT